MGKGERGGNQGGFHSFPTLKKEIKKTKIRAKKKKAQQYLLFQGHPPRHTPTRPPQKKEGELIRGINAPAWLGSEGRGRGKGSSPKDSAPGGPSSHRRQQERQE